nr:PREDICTED: serine/Arginine-related protein 53-like [Equus przewalskii]
MGPPSQVPGAWRSVCQQSLASRLPLQHSVLDSRLVAGDKVQLGFLCLIRDVHMPVSSSHRSHSPATPQMMPHEVFSSAILLNILTGRMSIFKATNTISFRYQSLFLDQATLVEQVKRVKEIEAIESDSFVQQTFRSSKEVKKSVEPSEVKHVAAAASGPASVTAEPPSNEKEIDPGSIPTAIKYQDDNSLAHPNLFIEKADAEEKWFKRLMALRQERLMGSPVA